MIKKIFFVAMIVILPCLWHTDAEAVRSFSIAQIPATVEFVMGSTNQAVTYRVTNNSTAGETITRVRFRLANSTYTNFPNPEAFVISAPIGTWTCTRGNATQITCSATAVGDYIASGGGQKNFTFNISSTASTQDRTDQLGVATNTLTSVRSGGTYYGPATTTVSGSWIWKSFLMTLVPSSFNVGQNCPFSLTMTVTNRTTSNITAPNYVTSQPKPPLRTSLSGGATAATASVPADFTLNSGLTSSMTWTYIAGASAGTLNFSSYARDSTSIRTSSTVTTNTITVTATQCNFIVSSLTVTPTCLLSGGTATFTMVVSNNTMAALNNVTPTWPPTINGTATIGAPTCTFPAGCTYNPLNSGLTGTFIWTAPVTANPDYVVGQDYWVTARGTSTTAGYLTTSWQDSNHQLIDGFIAAINPLTTNAQSTNEELVWSVTNSGCALVTRVSITGITPGWPAPSDTYSTVNNGAGTDIDTWGIVGIAGGAQYTFDIVANQMPVDNLNPRGTFSMFYPTTPVTAQTYTFNVTVTDINGVSKTIPTVITVNPYDPGDPSGLNGTSTGVWHEDVK